jgi:myosin heavy subunit
MKTLLASTPCYVRCIKPNANKAPLELDSQDVMRQLRSAGMLESIRKAGYSVRRTLSEFICKYRILVPKVNVLGAPVQVVRAIVCRSCLV